MQSTFKLMARVKCSGCSQSHDMELDLLDGENHRCACCRQMFVLPKHVMIADAFAKLMAGRQHKRITLKGRK